MEIREMQQTIDTWIKNTGKGYFSELTNLGILIEESGELARWIVRKYGDQSFKKNEDPLAAESAIQDEIADVLWVLTCLANQMNIDLEEAFEKNLLKKTSRDKGRHEL